MTENQKLGKQEPTDSLIATGAKWSPAVTRLSVGAYVVFCLSIAVLGTARGVSTTKLILFALAFLAIGLLGQLFANSIKRRGSGPLADVLARSTVVGVMLVGALSVSALFFGWPAPGAMFLAKMLDAPGLVFGQALSTVTISSSQPLSAVDDIFRHEPKGASETERVASLSNYPALRIQTSVISLNPDESYYLAANRLELNSATIRTNGGSLTIEVGELSTNASRIESFDTQQMNPSLLGRGGGNVKLIVHQRMSGAQLVVNLNGAPGVPGQQGNQGSPGGAGDPGEDAASHLFDCAHGAGNGQRGRDGGPGGNGTAGGPGGDGGVLTLRGHIDPSDIDARTQGAHGGTGGAAGLGGQGGPGGHGGSARGLCNGSGQTGPSGGVGTPGLAGANGPIGRPGKVYVQKE
jgi:hypothetical protein